MRSTFLSDMRRLALVLAGGILMAVNINTFVSAASLFPGGFSGLAILVQSVARVFFGVSLPYSLIVYALNIVPVIIGLKFIGRRFTLFSVVVIFVSGLLADLLPSRHLTDDVLLCSVFGGILNAAAVSCCLFGESSSGGIDFIAIFYSERTGKSPWNRIFAFNCLVLAMAGFLFGWDKALYSIIFQFASTQALNFFYRKYAKTTLLIVTDKSEEIYEIIRAETNHSATVFEGKGEFSGRMHKLVYTVVSSDECGKLEKKIRMADPAAFINVLQSKEIVGRFFKRGKD